MNILEVSGLTVAFGNAPAATPPVVNDVSFRIGQQECVGIVGESGSGKTLTALALLGLLPPAARLQAGSAQFQATADVPAQDLCRLSPEAMLQVRRGGIAMIFQAPASSLNPVYPCGEQVAEVLYLLQPDLAAAAAHKRVLELFRQVRLPDPERMYQAYPHQISGGQKQRIMIAMALASEPGLLVADEPTTALDPTVQKSVLDLLDDIRRERGLSMLFISHDLGVVARMCSRVIVMQQGEVVEQGPVAEVLRAPAHPYTRSLLRARPSLVQRYRRLSLDDTPPEPAPERAPADVPALLEVNQLHLRYALDTNWLGQPRRWLDAVQDVSFKVQPAEIFGLVGESGCGKTTLGKALTGLHPVHSGRILYKGIPLNDNTRAARRDIQMIFQHPYPALNPALTVAETLAEPLQVHRLCSDKERPERVAALLEMVGLQADHGQRYPWQFSGGQQQRLCIARALALEPRLLVCDEMVASLDCSVQALVLNLLLDLRDRLGISCVFISHDLAVIRQMCDRMLLLHEGRTQAEGRPAELFTPNTHARLRAMLEATYAL